MTADAAVAISIRRTSWCVVRPQEQHYLIYNSRTDELHLVPPVAFYAYRLCDPPISFDELEWLLARSLGEDGDQVHEHLGAFVRDCVARGILEVDDA